MARSLLLQTISVAALNACLGTAAFGQAIINGGGATSPQGDYAGANNPSTGAPLSEFSTYNAAQSAVRFGTYYGVGSTGQTALLNNDLTCDINKLTGNNGGLCSNTPGGPDTVHYAASDSVFTATQIGSWATSTYGQAASGNLIQIPSLGTGETIVIDNTAISKNGQLVLTDSDLCGVFSGKITNFNQLTLGTGSVTPTAGPITVVYRSDSSGATFILTNHLSAVCQTGATGNSNIAFTATTTFATLFPSGNVGAVIPQSIGEAGSSGVANYLAGLTSAGTITSAIGYVSPDWTSIPPAPAALLSNGQTSPLVVAAIQNGKRAYLPTTTSIELGLSHPLQGSNLTPPSTAAQGAQTSAWIPVIQQTSTGYPIVGYSTLDFAQCYATKAISTGLIAFLKLHYTNAAYTTIQANNGLAQIANAGASKFLAAVQKNILANKNGWQTDIGDKAVCGKLAGR